MCHPLSSSQSCESERALNSCLSNAVTKPKEQSQNNDKAYSFVAAFNLYCSAAAVWAFSQKLASLIKNKQTQVLTLTLAVSRQNAQC